MLEKMQRVLKNERGDISTVGKIVIACIVIVFLVVMTNTVLNWGQKKIEDTTTKVDQQFDEWNK